MLGPTARNRCGRFVAERALKKPVSQQRNSALLKHTFGTVMWWPSNATLRKEIESLVKNRQKIVVGVAAVAVVLAGGGGIAAVHSFATSPQTPTVQGPEDDVPGHQDLPEPGDHPDGSGQ
jgi:aspartate oxidase